MSARLIVIEGLDGAGKHTQTEIATSKLAAMGFSVSYVSFPDYDNPASAGVKMYLSGELGELSEVSAYAASLLYAVDRYTSFRAKWQKAIKNSDFVLCDRSTTSNITHQMSKLPRAQWDEFLNWLYDIEFGRLALPKPDLVLYLDTSPEVSRRLIYSRAGGDTTQIDIHEKNYEYMLKCRTSALYAAEHLGWQVVSCVSGDSMRDKLDIAEELMSYIAAAFGI